MRIVGQCFNLCRSVPRGALCPSHLPFLSTLCHRASAAPQGVHVLHYRRKALALPLIFGLRRLSAESIGRLEIYCRTDFEAGAGESGAGVI
jgi:hypothetical protein